MSLKVGIVGLPNVGKSTLFNALTRAQNAEAANYPFCTIEPNRAIVPVPDTRLDQLAAIVKPVRILGAVVEFTDIAGLVSGASRGEGLGNKFLAHIRETSAIVHVVRCFEDENVVHVDGSVDPLRDISVIQTELVLADMQTAENRMTRMEKQARSDKKVAAQLDVLKLVMAHLDAGNPLLSFQNDSEEYAQLLTECGFITAKPVISQPMLMKAGWLRTMLMPEPCAHSRKKKTPNLSRAAPVSKRIWPAWMRANVLNIFPRSE
jgi:GTP-binding protein YchF